MNAPAELVELAISHWPMILGVLVLLGGAFLWKKRSGVPEASSAEDASSPEAACTYCGDMASKHHHSGKSFGRVIGDQFRELKRERDDARSELARMALSERPSSEPSSSWALLSVNLGGHPGPVKLALFRGDQSPENHLMTVDVVVPNTVRIPVPAGGYTICVRGLFVQSFLFSGLEVREDTEVVCRLFHDRLYAPPGGLLCKNCQSACDEDSPWPMTGAAPACRGWTHPERYRLCEGPRHVPDQHVLKLVKARPSLMGKLRDLIG